jgi:membrane-associated protease RseP (regulator of RpoE activity)
MSNLRKQILVHSSLFVCTFLTTTLAGVQWLNLNPFELDYFQRGLVYSTLLLAFLLSHEFGHYFAAKAHGIATTLPYFLPFPAFLGLAPFGTFGAVIRLKSTVDSRKALFDIGAAGPLAGFIVTTAILLYGFRTLPPKEYLFSIHPEYASMAVIPEGGLTFGNSLLYWIIARSVPSPGAFVPPMNELYHYPFLCVGWFGLFVTAMNLIPVGQLDGGHITSVLFPRFHHRIAQGALIALMVFGTLGVLPLVGLPTGFGWLGWIIWALILAVFMRSRRLQMTVPPAEEELGSVRTLLGWCCVAILIFSFIPTPFF